jgi:hypothetical protein
MKTFALGGVAQLFLVRFMRACVAFLLLTTCSFLSGCMPIWDIELYNDTGHDIVVNGASRLEKAIIIPQGTSKPLDINAIESRQPEKVSIGSSTTSWSYPHLHQLFSSLVRTPSGLWRERGFPFGAFRSFARIDSRGRIYMLSPPQNNGGPQLLARQPAGFPLKPQGDVQ